MDKVIVWWGKGIFVALCFAIILLGTGPLGLSLPGAGVRAWSVSRTTFFIWLIWKLLICVRYGWSEVGFRKHAIPIPLLLFFAIVTLSLFPDYFHRAGDYRYFFLGSMHYLMILDLCSDQKRWRLIFYLLALSPGLLAVRGILYDPLILELDQMRRFEYPLPHPNIAGYLFAMTLPLCLAIAVGKSGKMRAYSLLSCGAQLLAEVAGRHGGELVVRCAGLADVELSAEVHQFERRHPGQFVDQSHDGPEPGAPVSLPANDGDAKRVRHPLVSPVRPHVSVRVTQRGPEPSQRQAEAGPPRRSVHLG